MKNLIFKKTIPAVILIGTLTAQSVFATSLPVENPTQESASDLEELTYSENEKIRSELENALRNPEISWSEDEKNTAEEIIAQVQTQTDPVQTKKAGLFKRALRGVGTGIINGFTEMQRPFLYAAGHLTGGHERRKAKRVAARNQEKLEEDKPKSKLEAAIHIFIRLRDFAVETKNQIIVLLLDKVIDGKKLTTNEINTLVSFIEKLDVKDWEGITSFGITMTGSSVILTTLVNVIIPGTLVFPVVAVPTIVMSLALLGALDLAPCDKREKVAADPGLKTYCDNMDDQFAKMTLSRIRGYVKGRKITK